MHFHLVVPDVFSIEMRVAGWRTRSLKKHRAVELSEIAHNVAVRCPGRLRRHEFLIFEGDDDESFDLGGRS